MPHTGLRLGLSAFAGILLSCTLAFGQAQPPSEAPPAQASPAPPPSPEPAPGAPAPTEKKTLTLTTGSTMTKWKWQEVKAKWAREKSKWADCRLQAKEQKLHAPKSWHFMADCMIKVAHPQPPAPEKTAR
jgi:hypothetical protein